MTSIEKLYPIRTIWYDHLQQVCSLRQLTKWASENVNFPTPARKIGRYNLYDVDEVIEWVTLWKRVTMGVGRGEDLNA